MNILKSSKKEQQECALVHLLSVSTNNYLTRKKLMPVWRGKTTNFSKLLTL